MKSTYKNQKIDSCSDEKKSVDYTFFIYGTHDIYKQKEDTFENALTRYVNDAPFTQSEIEKLSGILQPVLSRYMSGERSVSHDMLCAICIAIRLHPLRQRYLFKLKEWLQPDGLTANKRRSYIIREYLDRCAFDENHTLAACNIALKANGCKPLTRFYKKKAAE